MLDPYIMNDLQWSKYLSGGDFYGAISLTIKNKHKVIVRLLPLFNSLKEEEIIHVFRNNFLKRESTTNHFVVYKHERSIELTIEQYNELEVVKVKNYFSDLYYFMRNYKWPISYKLQREMGIENSFWGSSDEYKRAENLRDKFNLIQQNEYIFLKALLREINLHVFDIDNKAIFKNLDIDSLISKKDNLIQGIDKSNYALASIENCVKFDAEFKKYYNSEINN